MTWTWDWKVLWRKVLPNKELSEEKLFLTSRRIDWCNKTIVRFQNLLNLDYEFTVQIKKSILHCLMSWNLDYEFMDVFKKSLQDLKILWRKVCRIEELSEDKLFPTSWRIDWCNKTIVRFQNLLKFRLWVHGSDLKVNFALFDELKFRLWVHGSFAIWRPEIQKFCE